MNSLNQQIRDRVNAFAEELAQLVREAAVESVQEALGQAMASPTSKKAARRGRPTGAKKKAGRKKATKKKAGGRIRRSPEQLEATSAKILAHVKANPGQRLEQIAVDLGMDTADMKRPVSLLVGDGKLSTKGQKRGTTYYAGGGGRKKAARKAAGKKKASRKMVGKKKGARRKTQKKTSRKVAVGAAG